MNQNLHHHVVTVHHSAQDRGEIVHVVAPDESTARAQAVRAVRTRHGFPTSVTLFGVVK